MLFHYHIMMLVSFGFVLLVAGPMTKAHGQNTTTNNNMTQSQDQVPCLALKEVFESCQVENNCTCLTDEDDQTVTTKPTNERIDFTNYTQVLLFSYTKLDELCLGVATISCGASECCPPCQTAYENYGNCAWDALINSLVDQMVAVTVNFTNIPGFIDLEDLRDELTNVSCTYNCDLLNITSL